jgi:hypothetical protein
MRWRKSRDILRNRSRRGEAKQPVRQQRRRANLVHPHAHVGYSGNAVMALMIGAHHHGIQPGPQIMTERPATLGA